MNRFLFCLSSLGGALALTCCTPKGALAENFRPISRTQDKVSVVRTPKSTHDLRLNEYRKKGWRVLGESVLTSETRLSEYELKKTAALKGAHAVLISESSSSVKLPTKEPAVSSQKKVSAPAADKPMRTVPRVSGKTPPLPQQKLYRVEVNAPAPSPAVVRPKASSPPKTSLKQTQWSYRVSFLRHS